MIHPHRSQEFDSTKFSRREPITPEAVSALQSELKSLVPIITKKQTEASKYKKREKKASGTK